MDVDQAPPPKQAPQELVPECEIYLRLLILHHLLTNPDTYPKAIQLAHETVEKIQALNRRSMDAIASKVWYAVERAYELGGELADARPYVAEFSMGDITHSNTASVCSLQPSVPRHCGTTMRLTHL